MRSEGFEQKVVRAAGGAFNFNDNGLNANDINDDNSNNNVSSSARRAPSELLSPFFLLWTKTFEPATQHPANLVSNCLKGDVFFLVDCLCFMGESQKDSQHINMGTDSGK